MYSKGSWANALFKVVQNQYDVADRLFWMDF